MTRGLVAKPVGTRVPRVRGLIKHFAVQCYLSEPEVYQGGKRENKKGNQPCHYKQ